MIVVIQTHSMPNSYGDRIFLSKSQWQKARSNLFNKCTPFVDFGDVIYSKDVIKKIEVLKED